MWVCIYAQAHADCSVNVCFVYYSQTSLVGSNHFQDLTHFYNVIQALWIRPMLIHMVGVSSACCWQGMIKLYIVIKQRSVLFRICWLWDPRPFWTSGWSRWVKTYWCYKIRNMLVGFSKESWIILYTIARLVSCSWLNGLGVRGIHVYEYFIHLILSIMWHYNCRQYTIIMISIPWERLM